MTSEQQSSPKTLLDYIVMYDSTAGEPGPCYSRFLCSGVTRTDLKIPKQWTSYIVQKIVEDTDVAEIFGYICISKTVV